MKTKTPMLCTLLAALTAASAQDAIPGGGTPPPPAPPVAPAPQPMPPPVGMPGMAAGGGAVRFGATNLAPAIEVPAVRAEQIAEPIRWQYRVNGDFSAAGLDRKGPVAFLGVSASPPPSELAPHLPIDEDTGLVVEFISKDSPAEKAGLQQRDVLAKLDDQVLIHPRQLAVLVANHKEGEQVKITFVRKGQLQEANVVLGKQEPKKTVDLFHSTSEAAPSADVVIYGDSESPLKTFYRRVYKAGADGANVAVAEADSIPGAPGGVLNVDPSAVLGDEKAELQAIRKMLEDLTQRLEEKSKE